MSYEDTFAELKYLREDRDALLKERDALEVRCSELETACKGVAIMLNTKLERHESEPWAQRIRTVLDSTGS